MPRYILIVFALLVMVSCSDTTSNNSKQPSGKEDIITELPQKTVEINQLVLDKKTSLYYLEGTIFSGYVIRKYENDQVMQRMGILNGRKHKECIEWYHNGQVKSSSNYKQGKLQGKKSVWNNDTAHTLVALLNFENGKAEGEQKKWYPTGELYQILQMKDGREEGLQKAFRKNGKLYANYEAKNGRVFGMKKAALCFGLEDQKIKNNEK